MFRKYLLQPAIWHQQPLEFEWDAESGNVRGPGAEKLLGLVAAAVKDGYIVGHPYPTSFDINDPLHSVEEMAALLGNEWILPDDLAAAYPQSDEEENAVLIIDNGEEHQVEPIH